MTEEILDKSIKLKKEISELQNIINCLSYRIGCVKDIGNNPSNCNTPISIFYRMKLKLRNKTKEENDGVEQASIIIFDNDHSYGDTINVDEEFALYIKEYFVNKLNEKKKDFSELN